jgi:hypothetical protein
MASDNDLSALLPDPPPPRPARREAAIEEALRRFDAPAGAAPPRAAAEPAPARRGWARPQVAAFASIALVVLVSVPIWWADRDRILPAGPPDSPTASRDRSASGSPAIDVPPPPLAEPPPPVEGIAPPAIAAAPVPPSDVQPDAEAADQGIVVSGRRVQRSDFNSPTPITAVGEDTLAGGEWTDCTVFDPRRDLAACGALAERAARGGPDRAAAQVADGLAFAWRGDLDRSIGAFDRAIRAEPDLAVAYLNRGLAYRAKGDPDRALADLNRAIARDGNSARAYYHRSLLHRERGDTARAERDAQRAIALDPDYRAVLP